MKRSNVTSIRPYDHEREDAMWVSATPLEWSVLAAAVERAQMPAATEVMERISAEVMAAQLLRFKADIADANYDYLEGA